LSETQQAGSQDGPINLRVVHGHLAFAQFPILVGHYVGDAFAGTEARLDRALDGRLAERRKLGLYPGRIGANAVLLHSDCKPPGAVVVGLGQPAGLSIGMLRETLRQGVLAYMVATRDRGCASAAVSNPAMELGLSCLLVGSGAGGVDRISCVQALLQAVAQANAMLGRLPSPGLRALEIIELFEDRAYETARVARKAIDGDPVLKSVFSPQVGFEPRGGGRRAGPLGQDPNWWQPIQITMPSDPKDRSLSFTIGGGFARAEARTIAANLDIVEPLLRRSARNIDIDGSPTSPGRILFELLWPDSLKQRSAEEQHRRLILDEQSAAFPWELLDDRRPWTSDDVVSTDAVSVERPPPAVRSGLVRQLLQFRSAEKVVAVAGKPKALIIADPGADPPSGFPRLEGAQREADEIAKLLQPTHDVTPLKTKAATPEQVFKQLLGQAWEIVHISAHGVVDYAMSGGDDEKRTGIVLSETVVMGPAELSRLPVSPSIFFVNCCNLGTINAADENSARQEALEGRPELAASVAVQLIQNGVRCVIVAGWEVNDDAAAAFGKTFYREMLAGASFGDATLKARQAAYRPNDNTWGAFQCYGDPDYRLRRMAAQPPTSDGGDQFVGVSEAVIAAEQIRDEVNVGLERAIPEQRKRLAGIEKEAEANRWFTKAQLRAALGEARAELGDLPEAIAHYTAALSSNKAAFSVRAVEQLANLSARNAVRTFRARPDDDQRANATATVEDWLRKLERLTDAVGRTPERLSLQASTWKRLAQIRSSGVDEALATAKAASDESAGLGGDDPDYPLYTSSYIDICMAIRDGKPWGPVAEAALRRMAQEPPPQEDDFWKLVRSADARICVAILDAAAGRDPAAEAAEIDGIKEAYQRAWSHIGSPVKMSSVIEQLEFYEDIFSSGADGAEATRKRIRAFAADLRGFIENNFWPGLRSGGKAKGD
jgi:CHAT domain-containing protein